MAPDQKFRVQLYELYLTTAERVSDRRAQSNAWMLSVNSGIVALYGYLRAGQEAQSDVVSSVWLWAIPTAGALVSLAWAALLSSYRSLNRAKFVVLMEIERAFPEDLPAPLFSREREIYQAQGRTPLSHIESAVPWVFVALYGAMILAAAIV